jgi:hypothetical protein
MRSWPRSALDRRPRRTDERQEAWSLDEGLLPLVDLAYDLQCALDIGRHDGSEVAGRVLVEDVPTAVELRWRPDG